MQTGHVLPPTLVPRPPPRKETSNVPRSTTAIDQLSDDPCRTASARSPSRAFGRRASRRRGYVVSDARTAPRVQHDAASPPASPRLQELSLRELAESAGQGRTSGTACAEVRTSEGAAGRRI